MQSKATTVDEYLKEVPADRLEALTRIRDLCREHLHGYEEAMEYGMPVYRENGVGEIAFNNQKNYISVYVKTSIVDKYRDQLKDAGKCCVRFSNPNKIDFDLLRTLIIETRDSPAEPC